jgi:hypothetical protein
MLRKTIITITGEDDSDQVGIHVEFVPGLDNKEPPPSAWGTATVMVLELLNVIKEEGQDGTKKIVEVDAPTKEAADAKG